MRNYIFEKTHRNLLKHANIHIDRATNYQITVFLKNETFLFFGAFFFKITIADILNF